MLGWAGLGWAGLGCQLSLDDCFVGPGNCAAAGHQAHSTWPWSPPSPHPAQRGQDGDGEGRKSVSPLSRKFQSRSFVACSGVLLLVIMLQCCSAAVLQCGRMMKCNELRTAVTGGPSTIDRVKPQLQVFSREV